MGILSMGVVGIILGMVLLAIVWVIIRNVRKRMIHFSNDRSAASFSESNSAGKRDQTRVELVWSVIIETSGGNISAKTKNLSIAGAFIICREPLPLSERFCLTIEAPGREPMPLNSEVVWSNSKMPDDKIINRGMGIRFINNTDENRELLKTAISAAAAINDSSS